jgi:RimJ/RimL family protein N-acetyltransferase
VTSPVTLPLPLPDPALVDGDLSLRPWQDGDVHVLAGAWADPEISRWTGAPADPSVEGARRWIAGERDRRTRGLALDLVIADGGLPVGEIGITRFDRHRRTAEIGWWVVRSHRGRGLATRAARLVAAWAVTELCIDRVYARVDPRNPRSLAVARSAGLQRLGAASDGLEVWATPPHRMDDLRCGATVRA